MYTIDTLNQSSREKFIEILGGIFEDSPWIAEKAAAARPFSSREALFREMAAIVEGSSKEQKLALIQAHPDLGGRMEMSTYSNAEQEGAGLKHLTSEEYEKFQTMNQRYMEKFGFPFILAVRGKSKDDIYNAMKTRVDHGEEKEFETALQEICKIACLRLQEIVL
ncbi:2-oxo-4-hydroxy-4-carboxy-5-ureidoimidazoline decarboxylase [Heyndrickxia acidiproducens]|uniref:2-oxo-4-hydroxy-4-carboxy-5-ureidoimidazoline decarboxylase n=1 Tax=Heyndrickxia acidiproducens TaxID=1121084 RepID=UPI0003614966|nr:2-oxo-4-hydroxy-4-carboxy-5-ureidoimidazoline decarboxylase [Heyndrickxia acidiproducens]